MTILTKTDWRKGFNLPSNNPQAINPDELVKVWAYPVGAICQIVSNGGVNTLINGSTGITDKPLVNELCRLGIRGEIIIYATNIIPQNIPSWITWWCMEGYEKSLNGKNHGGFLPPDVSIYFRNGEVNDLTQLNLLKMHPMMITAAKAESFTRAMSRDMTIGTFRIEMQDGRVYKLEPNRVTRATVIGVCDDFFLLRSANGQTFPVRKIRHSVESKLKVCGLSRQWLIGKTVLVSYTALLNGNRFCNFVSAVLNNCDKLDTVYEEYASNFNLLTSSCRTTESEGIHELSSQGHTYTLSRLNKAEVEKTEDGWVLAERGKIVFKLTRTEPKPCDFYIQTNDEFYRLETDYDLGNFSIEAIVSVLSEQLNVEFVSAGIAI